MMEQAIADYAVMIESLREQYKFTKVVIFGGRYVHCHAMVLLNKLVVHN